jgi:pimeloyl-ACP methyl ester carboxylesterase
VTKFIVAAALAAFPIWLATSSNAASLLGHEVRPGATVDAEFPIGSYFQDYAATGGNPRPATGRAVLIFPNNFDPARAYPILIVTSTTDMGRTSPMDAPWYRQPAGAEGWIVLAPDATIKPRNDSSVWRLAILAAALEAIRHDWPRSAQWPVALAGLSGGAKRSCVLAAMLAKSGTIRLCGIFLAGMNDDRLTPAYNEYKPGAGFLNVPVWLSSGDADQIAPPRLQEKAFFSIKRTAFKHVRFEGFFGGHQINQSEVRRALQWFRELGRF